jgi:YD repeat-containing protein
MYRRPVSVRFLIIASASAALAALSLFPPSSAKAAPQEPSAGYQPLQSVSSPPSIPVGSGPVRSATFMSFSMSDRVSLRVNMGSGNALVTTNDITVPEIGSSLVLGTSYNSLLTGSGVAAGSNGSGWRQREGIDVQLYPASDGSVTYLGEDGTAGKFSPSGSGFTSPAQFHVTLVKSAASTCGGTGYTMTWHATGRVMCFTSAGLLSSEADRNGNTTKFSYNSSGQETQVAFTPHGASAPTRTVSVSYTGSFLTGLSQSGGGLTRNVSYRVNSAGDLNSLTQADGTQILFGYDSSHNLTSVTNGDSAQTTLTYNSSHQVLSVTQPTTTGTVTATTRFAYPNSTTTEEADPNTDQSQPVGSVPRVTYTVGSTDALITKVVDQQGDSRSTSYTPFDDVAAFTNGVQGTSTNTFGSNGGESLTKSQGPTGAADSLAYGNSATSTNPTANFQPSSSTDPQANATAYTYDGAGNLLQSANALPAVAKVTYNSDGTPATSTDPKNGTNRTSYGYTDGNHELTTVTPPTGNSLKPRMLTYDGFGRLATSTDGAGNTATYTYDKADRLTQVAYTGGPKPLTVSYGYDGAGNLVSRTDPSGATTFAFDGRNLVLSRTASSGGGTLSYGYDLDGNLTSVTDPLAQRLAGSATATYTYNDRNLLTGITDPAGKQWFFMYDADGRRILSLFGTNATQTTYLGKITTHYDKAGRISSIQAVGSGNGTIFSATYCHSPFVSGQSCPTSSSSTDRSLLEWVQTNAGFAPGTAVFSYDKGNRLTKATSNVFGATSVYGYDADGNMTSANDAGTTSTFTFNSANQITSSGYAYDGAGNQVSDPSAGTLAYSDADQMISAASGAETFSYADRTQAELLADGSAAGITYGLAGQDGQPWVQDYTASAGEQVNVLHDQQGGILGEVNSNTGTARADIMYVTDGLGSVVATIDSSGHATLTQPYTPYGLDAQTGPLDPMFTYTGALQDTIGTTGGTGYYHLGNRWYAPPTEPDTGIGKQSGPAHFTQPDANTKLVSPADGNLYAYAACDPANYIDPAGTQAIYDWVCGFGLFAGGWAGAIGSVASDAALWGEFGLGSALAGTICYSESLNSGLSSQALLQTGWITNMTVP